MKIPYNTKFLSVKYLKSYSHDFSQFVAEELFLNFDIPKNSDKFVRKGKSKDLYNIAEQIVKYHAVKYKVKSFVLKELTYFFLSQFFINKLNPYNYNQEEIITFGVNQYKAQELSLMFRDSFRNTSVISYNTSLS